MRIHRSMIITPYVNEYIYLGIVEAVKDNLCRIEQRNNPGVWEIRSEIMKPDGTNAYL